MLNRFEFDIGTDVSRPRPRRRRLLRFACILLVSSAVAAWFVRPLPWQLGPAEETEEPWDVTEFAQEGAPPLAASPASRSQPRPARVVTASWYDVPVDSLAKRRAGLRELTAAHDKLPLGTRVRVTHLENGKSVTVRITDRGIQSRKIKLDICREAAQELDMVSEGLARVRMEVLSEESGAVADAQASAPQQ